MLPEEDAPSENFRDKYVNPGRIGLVLVDRFYKAVHTLLDMRSAEIRSILEVGAGEGFSTQRIRQMIPPGVRLEASEYCANLVRIARKRNPGILIVQESIYALARESDSYDTVICLEVLEHLERPRDALEELARVSGKYAIVSVPREPIWRMLNLLRGKYIRSFGNTPGHIQHWSARTIREFVAPFFHVIEMHTPLPWTILFLQKRK